MQYSNRGEPPIRQPLVAAVLAVLLLAGCTASSGPKARSEAATRARLDQLTKTDSNPVDDPASLRTAAGRDRGDNAAQKRYATDLAKAGRNAEALDAALSLYGRDKADIDVGLLIGRLYVRLDNGAAAAATYQELVARDANSLEALNGLGIAEVMQQSLPDAEATFHRAVALAPADSASRNNLALAFMLEHKANDAIGILEPLWQEDNTSRRVRTNLAMAYAAAGQRDKASALLSPIMGPAEVEKSIKSYTQLSGDGGKARKSSTSMTTTVQAQAGGKPGRRGG